MQVTNLYRYPVKSLTPEVCESLQITDDGRVVGDRVLAFRFNDAGPTDDLSWKRKSWFASLQHAPRLARITSNYDSIARVLTVHIPDSNVVVSGKIDDPEDRLRMERAVTQYALQMDRTPFARNARHQPFRLVGDGISGRFHDTAAGRTTLHSRGSAIELARALGIESIDDVRFRSNIVIEAARPWQEFDWRGKRLLIGNVEFKVLKPVVRCLATHANPRNGERDLDVMNTLTRIIGQEEPQFAISIVPVNKGGEIKLGDAVNPL